MLHAPPFMEVFVFSRSVTYLTQLSIIKDIILTNDSELPSRAGQCIIDGISGAA